MAELVYMISIPVRFPEGLAPGDGKGGSNRLVISKNGRNKPVLRGSAITGVLRSAYKKSEGVNDEDVEIWSKVITHVELVR